MAASNRGFGCLNPNCPGDCRTSWLAQRRTLSPTFTWHEPGFEPTTWRPLVQWVARGDPSKGAYRALCTRCAKSWLFSNTGSSVSSED